MDETNTKFGYKKYQNNLKNLIKFEVKSFFGRLLSPKLRINKYNLINIGCGNQIYENFENIDFYATRFWKAKYIGHDLRYKFPFKDNSFEGAFCDNVLEHLHPSDAINFLKDVKRILKDGAVFRIIVPDLERYIIYYNNQNLKGFQHYGNGCNAIWNLTHNWGHLSTWDFQMISHQLKSIGYKDIKKCKIMEGQDYRLLKDNPGREWECLFVECRS
ncbi:class I SAM-dependent methyltransferase [Candidatus Pelagibacter sp. HIMB1748]|uniref:class I SAM-dependent methyltransferase n=1 Tax=unclassified Candidatus Pelagibacter TaxID=2647897 RepID=UPI003F845FCB